jgi:hypothetical protein
MVLWDGMVPSARWRGTVSGIWSDTACFMSGKGSLMGSKKILSVQFCNGKTSLLHGVNGVVKQLAYSPLSGDSRE